MLPIQPDDPGTNVGGDGGGGGGGGGAPPTTPGGIPGRVVFEVAFNKHEAASALRILAYASLTSPDDLQFTAYVGVNGGVYQQTAVNLVLDNKASRGAMPITLPAFVTGLPAGNNTVTFAIRNLEPDGALTVLTGSVLEITELKQGSL